MESYCGKDCESCTWKERLRCAGCEEGMGRRFSGPCEIAACCREKGHQRCDTCGHVSGCPPWAGRDEVPARELRRREAERARQETLAEQAPILGKWLWLLFWLVVPREAGGLLAALLGLVFPWMNGLGTVLVLVCALASAFFFWKLGPARQGYRAAALCQLAIVVLNVPGQFLPEGHPALTVIGLGVIGLGLYRNYHAYSAHAQALDEVDSALAEEWRRLWKYTVWDMCGIAASILLLLMIPVLGLLLVLACSLGLLVLAVLEMVCLWRTAKVFREYRPPETPEA